MKAKNAIIAIASLAVGVAVGWFARGVGESSFAKATEDRREGRASIAAKPKRKAPICLAEEEVTTNFECSLAPYCKVGKDYDIIRLGWRDNTFEWL